MPTFNIDMSNVIGTGATSKIALHPELVAFFAPVIKRVLATGIHETLGQFDQNVKHGQIKSAIAQARMLYTFLLKDKMIETYDDIKEGVIEAAREYAKTVATPSNMSNRERTSPAAKTDELLYLLQQLSNTLDDPARAKFESWAENEANQRAKKIAAMDQSEAEGAAVKLSEDFKKTSDAITKYSKYLLPEAVEILEDIKHTHYGTQQQVLGCNDEEKIAAAFKDTYMELFDKHRDSMMIVAKQIEALPEGEKIAAYIDTFLEKNSDHKLATQIRKTVKEAIEKVEPATQPAFGKKASKLPKLRFVHPKI